MITEAVKKPSMIGRVGSLLRAGIASGRDWALRNADPCHYPDPGRIKVEMIDGHTATMEADTQGKIAVRSGNVTDLRARASRDGQIRFDGSVVNAHLEAGLDGIIRVDEVRGELEAKETLGGDIQVSRSPAPGLGC